MPKKSDKRTNEQNSSDIVQNHEDECSGSSDVIIVKETQDPFSAVSPEDNKVPQDNVAVKLDEHFEGTDDEVGTLKDCDKKSIESVLLKKINDIETSHQMNFQTLMTKRDVEDLVASRYQNRIENMRADLATLIEKNNSLKECIRKEKIVSNNKITAFKEKKHLEISKLKLALSTLENE